MNNNETHTLVLTNEELTAIFNALAEQSYKTAAPIIDTMQNQLKAEFEEKKKKFETKAEEKK